MLATAVVAGATLLPVLAIEVVLRWLPVSTATSAMALDDANPVMRYAPNQRYVYSKGWNFQIVNYGRINNYGFVNDEDYREHPDGDGPLVIIGDSYVEAMMVPYAHTVHGRLARVLAPQRQVYSLGTSGSQLADYLQYARYAEGTFHPCALVFVIVGNDFDESLVRYQRGVGYHFDEGGADGFRIVRTDYHPSRWKRILRQSALVRYLWSTVGVAALAQRGFRQDGGANFVGNTDASASAERLARSRAAVDFFLSRVTEDSGLPPSRILFVVDAARPDVYSAEPEPRGGASYFHLMRQYFSARAAGLGFEVIDMQPRFEARHRREGVKFEFAIDGHWNDLGHEEAANAIAASATLSHAVMRRS